MDERRNAKHELPAYVDAGEGVKKPDKKGVARSVSPKKDTSIKKKATEDKDVSTKKKATEDKDVSTKKKATEDKDVSTKKKATEDKDVSTKKKATEDKDVSTKKKAMEDKDVSTKKKATEKIGGVVKAEKKSASTKQDVPDEPKKKNAAKQKTTDEIGGGDKSKKAVSTDLKKKEKDAAPAVLVDAAPSVLVDAVSNLLYGPLLGETMSAEFEGFKLTSVFKEATPELSKEAKESLHCATIMVDQTSTVYKKFKDHCNKRYCPNEFACLSLLAEMLHKQSDDYAKFVTSFNDVWEKYFDPNQPGERVNSYLLEPVAKLHAIFWDKKKKAPTPLSDDVILAAKAIIGEKKIVLRADGED